MTQYILQKDLPNLKAGATFSWDKIDNAYTAIYSDGKGNFVMNNFSYTKEEVESNTEWFFPVGNLAGATKEYWMAYDPLKQVANSPEIRKDLTDKPFGGMKLNEDYLTKHDTKYSLDDMKKCFDCAFSYGEKDFNTSTLFEDYIKNIATPLLEMAHKPSEEKSKPPFIFFDGNNSKTKFNNGGIAQHSICNLVRRIDGYSFDDCKIVMNLSNQEQCNQSIDFLTILKKCLPK